MRIVADLKIPLVEESFGTFGEVVRLPAEEISSQSVAVADVLLVRSETRVDGRLLENSRVRFVGSPTSGVDHIDLDYLAERGIAFASAPGCNADSVCQYVITAMLNLSVRHGQTLPGSRLGLVGCGQIGSRVRRCGQALGMEVLVNDPPLARGGMRGLVDLKQLDECDFISLHVPLTTRGPDRTFHLFDRERLARLSPGTVLINTSRGAVVENRELKKSLEDKRLRGAVLDVWEEEPSIDIRLVELVDIGTPHIAGYSWNGKVRGTWMVYLQFCDFQRLEPQWEPLDLNPEPELLEYPAAAGGTTEQLARIVQAAYAIEADDERLRKLSNLRGAALGRAFRNLRKTYPKRREFRCYRVETTDNSLSSLLTQLGFQVG